jgi:hypothetical protein
MSPSSLTDLEIKDIANKLAKLSPHGFIPYDLFVEFTRLKVTITIEVVPLCLDPNGEVNVVLYNRGPNDLWWPNLYHTPGTCLIADDIPDSDEWGLPTRAFERLKNTELKDLVLIGEPKFVGNISHQVRRGPESDHVYIQEVEYNQKLNCFYKTNSLPLNLMDHQIGLIKKCSELFLAQKSSILK